MKISSGILIAVAVLTSSAISQQKLAQTGLKFLSVGTDPRAVAMGEAVTAMEWGSQSLFYNPSTMARVEGTGMLTAGTMEWIADIRHYYLTLGILPFGSDIGVFGISVHAVDYGELQETIRANNEQGFIDLGTFKPSGLAIGLGYARALSDKFSIGGQVKYVSQDLGSAVVSNDAQGNPEESTFKTDAIAFDFGILYRTGFKSLNFGMTVRNFATELIYVEESFQLPLTFKIGVSMNMVDLTDLDAATHALLFAVDAEHPRDYPEQVRIGLEYTFMKLVAFRGGVVFPNDEYNYSFGIGLMPTIAGASVGVNYSFTPFERFNSVHRFSFLFSL